MLEASGQFLLEPWFSETEPSLSSRVPTYIADTGLLCALLNIRSEEKPFASRRRWAPSGRRLKFAQLRDRERRAAAQAAFFSGVTEPAKWTSSWMPVDRPELLESKWTELPDAGDTVNLELVRNTVGKAKVDWRVPSLANTEQFSILELFLARCL